MKQLAPGWVRVVLVDEEEGMPAGSTGQIHPTILHDTKASIVFVFFDENPISLSVSISNVRELT